MDEEEREELDDAFRAIAVGYAVLDEAENNPAFRVWLNQFLAVHLTDPAERMLFDLPDNPVPVA